jgi:hypothetical protein
MIKTLPESIGHGGTWENSLINDLAYIKQNLRYRITKKTLMPSLIGILLLLSPTTFVIFFYISLTGGKMAPVVFLLILNITTTFSVAFRYWNTLKFKATPTDLFLQENKALLEQFLRAQQLLVFRHPEMPEVFQILSRNLIPSQKQEKREVIIFIADDKRILINSHFTGSGWNIIPEKRHDEQMAENLKEWIKSHSSAGTSLTHQTF